MGYYNKITNMKNILWSLLFLLICPVKTSAFSDVDALNLNYDAILYVEEQGIVSGYSDGTFGSDKEVNRAELSKILIETAYPRQSFGTDCFPDVNKQWFAKYVCLAREKGIVDGYPNGNFKPEQAVTFIEAAKMITKAFKLPLSKNSATEWYVPYVIALEQKKAIPLSITYYEQPISRGELAEIVYRIKAGIGTKESRIFTGEKSYANIKFIDIEELLTKYGVPYKTKTITAFTTDESGSHFAIVFYDSESGAYQIYKDNKKIYEKTISEFYGRELTPVLFRFTNDGKHLLYAIEPQALYLDDLRLSSDDNLFNYYSAVFSADLKGDNIIFPETESIIRYEPLTKTRSILFRLPGKKLEFVRIQNGHYYYTVSNEQGQTDLYRDGKKISVVAVDNPANYLISGNGSVYYFSASGKTYQVYQNDRLIFAGIGRGGFLYEDPNENLYHVGYEMYQKAQTKVYLYKNGKKVSDQIIGNIEGYMAFSENGFHYATRASPGSEPEKFYLFKDGTWQGQPFSLSEKKDYRGVQFLGNTTFMRNYDNNRWVIYKDGQGMNSNLRNIWHFKISDSEIFLYGTRF